jgi:hypothetical protein
MNHRGLTKPLRIKWEDEEGIDAGGLRKEWFLLLCRKLFDPQFGMFLVDEESQYVWFNPAAVGMEDDFWLVGVTTGLALFNGANLDIPLPPVTYKLLAAASTSLKLSDLADLNPSLARGLDQLLNHPAEDVESTFCRTFVGQYEAWGEVVEVDLVENGSEVPVTGQNRQGQANAPARLHKYGCSQISSDRLRRFDGRIPPRRFGLVAVCELRKGLFRSLRRQRAVSLPSRGARARNSRVTRGTRHRSAAGRDHLRWLFAERARHRVSLTQQRN